MGGGGGGYTGGIRDSDELRDAARRRISETAGEERTYNVFIPHAWDYEEEYQRLLSLLEDVEDFDFRDYSIPRDDPLETATDAELEEALRNQIRPVSVVVVPAGMYAAHRRWIEKEIEIARELRKPIVAVRPWGSQMMPRIVEESADEVVGWHKEFIVDAIRRVRRDYDEL
ncbi:MAG: TIR domain-containing protein [Thermoplasmata archaeon]